MSNGDKDRRYHERGFMRYYAAPMEGITGHIYRKTHYEYFGGCDRYYMPFLDPKDHASLMKKEKRDIRPENNEGVPVVPQILTNKPDKFLKTARMLYGLGYPEVNLNLGCPSATVVSGGKGSGFLACPDQLDAFFDKVFADPLFREEVGAMRLSVKTRLGMEQPEEILGLIPIYNRYPICELIIHARVREDMYKKPVRREMFSQALVLSTHPVCYNGDIFSLRDQQELLQVCPTISCQLPLTIDCQVPSTTGCQVASATGCQMPGGGWKGNLEETLVPGQEAKASHEPAPMPGRGLIADSEPALMLGRGLIADPELALMLKDGKDSYDHDLSRWRDFLDELCLRYEAEIGNNTLYKMKEIWRYMLPGLTADDSCPVSGAVDRQKYKSGKKLMKARKLSDYKIYASHLFDLCL